MPIIPLALLPVGRKAIVQYVSPGAPSYRRMLDLGLVRGTQVEAVRSSPFGDPKAYLIRGATVAIRREDATAVLVEPAGD